jgi:hypothetical protein
MHHTTTPGQAMHFCCIKARAWLPPMAAGGIKKSNVSHCNHTTQQQQQCIELDL